MKSEGSTDLRVRRTRKLLWDALMALLGQSGRTFESLTVAEICERAMVHRTTFYKHFEDKYHLLCAGFEELNKELAAMDVEERMIRPMQLLERIGHQRQFRTMMKSDQESTSVKSLMHRIGSGNMKNDLLALERKDGPFPVPAEIIAEFYTGAITSLGAWWVQHGSDVPAETMDRYIGELLNPAIFNRQSLKSAGTDAQNSARSIDDSGA
ncbi:TetR/AcrR family transcriptional regulator [Cohnella sp. JJ-181]|uniref:TetR/AcrR family transcriptional regulator n=1 Tax=Cohnella rhizoplanae TaxID=2974897 RepID=UPI00232DCA08|nr:TetR/AcrR family transcriptional regulator [Cohnella sp. JJ-181]